MSVLDKLKTAVRGNPVMREYELQRHIGSGGPSSLWKIYDGVKKSTRQVKSERPENKLLVQVYSISERIDICLRQEGSRGGESAQKGTRGYCKLAEEGTGAARQTAASVSFNNRARG